MYTVKQLARLWQVSDDQIRRIFRGREGVVNLSGNPGKPTWRIPASLAMEVAIERGYTPKPPVS